MAFGETAARDEELRFKGYADEIGAIQRARVAKRGVAGRVMHVKQHLGAVGELLVTAPDTARFGVFAELGKSWPVYARFSNGSGVPQGDGGPDVRGFALKLVGVPGKKLILGLESAQTQDFLFIDSPALPFRDPDEFMWFVRAAKDGPLPLPLRLLASFGLKRGFGILKGSLTAAKVTSFATHAFHTAAPIAFGATAAKLALFPEPSNPPAPPPSGADYLRQELSDRLRRGPVTWRLRAQLFVDQTTTPIEDTSVLWSGDWIDLAKLTLPKQDVASPRGNEISEVVTQLSFDPWHATEDHRPLGAIMRARAAAYAASAIGRNAAPEPTSVLEPSR